MEEVKKAAPRKRSVKKAAPKKLVWKYQPETNEIVQVEVAG